MTDDQMERWHELIKKALPRRISGRVTGLTRGELSSRVCMLVTMGSRLTPQIDPAIRELKTLAKLADKMKRSIRKISAELGNREVRTGVEALIAQGLAIGPARAAPGWNYATVDLYQIAQKVTRDLEEWNRKYRRQRARP